MELSFMPVFSASGSFLLVSKQEEHIWDFTPAVKLVLNKKDPGNTEIYSKGEIKLGHYLKFGYYEKNLKKGSSEQDKATEEILRSLREYQIEKINLGLLLSEYHSLISNLKEDQNIKTGRDSKSYLNFDNDRTEIEGKILKHFGLPESTGYRNFIFDLPFWDSSEFIADKIKKIIIQKSIARLFCYKMTHDTGFAPNPFHGMLTLATCKPDIRKSKKIGDWIVGFTSKKVNERRVEEKRLIYLMQVTDKITFAEYWDDLKYKCKKANMNSGEYIEKVGDNIYMPLVICPDINDPDNFVQVGTKYHKKEGDAKKDLKGEYVLISKNFYYFGGHPFDIDTLSNNVTLRIPEMKAPYGWETKDPEIVKRFITYVHDKYKEGVINFPHNWSDKSGKVKNNYKNFNSCK